MLEAKTSQFTLSAEGQILWQEKLNNPLPGIAVAVLEKGETALKPVLHVLKNEQTEKYDQVELKNSLNMWLNAHFNAVLEPLMMLEVPQGVVVKDDAVSQISTKIYNGLGIVPRGDLETMISELTPETRADLRAKKIRLGPILAFIPALNKPAAVKLRALLWSLFHGKELPAKVPADGIVSVKIEDAQVNEDYYRSIGYPLYGGRAVRIDMLDRVISCVYDNATDGKFQARHEMAEWLGCPIEDLYKVLVSMGHVKVYDPAVEKAKIEAELKESEVSEDVAKIDNVPVEKDVPVEDLEVKSDDEAGREGAEDKAKPKDAKPELATFRLKKGKAFQKGSTGKSFENKPQKSKGSKIKKDSKKKPRKDTSPRVMSAEAKVNDEDSPFAILQQLKK
ncbi:MAG: hypothetical protein COA45_01075 [Zetaproteobacteria bacterium]|nr:MAG: hypothetical protein COA45_01075 [Zetaproteobacteria bacterium]